MLALRALRERGNALEGVTRDGALPDGRAGVGDDPAERALARERAAELAA
jgi:hypothetical protein